MKITKRQLRRIINEEKQKLLAEADLNTLRRMRVDINDVLMKHGVDDPVEAAAMLRMLADKIEDNGIYDATPALNRSAEDEFVDAGIRARMLKRRS